MTGRAHSLFCQLLAALPFVVAALPSYADCSRDILVPVSTTGVSVIVSNGTYSGIYPEIFRSLGPRAGCHFTFTSVPRARQELLFEAGKADLLLPATRTPARDLNQHEVGRSRSMADKDVRPRATRRARPDVLF